MMICSTCRRILNFPVRSSRLILRSYSKLFPSFPPEAVEKFAKKDGLNPQIYRLIYCKAYKSNAVELVLWISLYTFTAIKCTWNYRRTGEIFVNEMLLDLHRKGYTIPIFFIWLFAYGTSFQYSLRRLIYRIYVKQSPGDRKVAPLMSGNVTDNQYIAIHKNPFFIDRKLYFTPADIERTVPQRSLKQLFQGTVKICKRPVILAPDGFIEPSDYHVMTRNFMSADELSEFSESHAQAKQFQKRIQDAREKAKEF